MSRNQSNPTEGGAFRSPAGIEDARPGEIRTARFGIGDVVKHRIFPFRGVVFDVDPEFANTEEWWLAIPEAVRPAKDQPFYHLLAENEDSSYVAYVSQQNLLPDSGGEVRHPRQRGRGAAPGNSADLRRLPRRAVHPAAFGAELRGGAEPERGRAGHDRRGPFVMNRT